MRRHGHSGASAPELLHGRADSGAQADDLVEVLRVLLAAGGGPPAVHLRVEGEALGLAPRHGFHLQLLRGEATVAGDVLGLVAGGQGAAEVEVGRAGAVHGARGASSPGSGAGGHGADGAVAVADRAYEAAP